jgi:hypothetical protein
MSERDVRERDILVAPGEYAYVQDLTKGDIVLYVGPTKISLSNTERLVELRGGRFVAVRADEAGVGVASNVAATHAQYIVLENPPKDPTQRPVKGPNTAIELLWGRRVVVPGPASFPLWPGQRARVVDGHALREDEYLIVKVVEPGPDVPQHLAGPIGHLSVVRGSDVTFFVPTTGLEVVPGDGGYVRKAHRLRKGMGLHLRVAKAFEAKDGDQVPQGRYEAGQDLFLHDREGYFFPTEHLEIVGEVSAIPIAEREGLYARDLLTGRITTIEGPMSYLPDPTKVEIVLRTLGPETARLYRVRDPASERAIAVDVPSGFAVLVTAKDRREVVRGPTTRILAFDEDLEILELSTGRPKSAERTLPTCFLQVEGNKVSDVVRVKTRDHNELELELSYRVSFVEHGGPKERWFRVKDYVGLLCDHLGSLVRGAARQSTLESLHEDAVELVRGVVLGEKPPGGPRPGRVFEENGLWVYDVEVLDVRILDDDVKDLLEQAQRNALVAEVKKREQALRLETERLREEVERGVLQAKLATLEAGVRVEEARRALGRAEVESRVVLDREERLGRAQSEAEAFAIAQSARHAAEERSAELERRVTEARVEAFAKQMQAMAPELVATLKTLGHQKLAADLAKSAAPLAILGGESVSEVVERLLGALPVGASSDVRAALRGNGKTPEPARKRE